MMWLSAAWRQFMAHPVEASALYTSCWDFPIIVWPVMLDP
jgi:hypothetical protein